MKYVIKNGAVSINGETILESINLEINEKSHIGIVGKNGAGKTTLLQCIVDNSLLEEGTDDTSFQVIKQGNPSIGYLRQIELNDNNTMLEEVRKPFRDIIKIEDRLEELVREMNTKDDIKLVEEYTSLEEKFQNMGGYTYRKEYEILIKKFGFKDNDKFKYLKEFSGGEKTKIAFIKMLLNKPDILLLDEPTNHLDIDTVEWLEEYLKNYKKAIVVVSHDRMFINNIVDTIYDISYGALTKYSGNYDYYEKQKQLNYEKALKDYEFQRKEIERLTRIYERFRSKPSKAKMAMSRLHQLEKMDILERPNKIEAITFKTNMDNIVMPSRDIFILDNLGVGYDRVLYKLNLYIRRGDKLGIIGPNGLGKSTILKTLVGLIPSLGGSFTVGHNVSIGYFDQSLAMLDEKHTVLEEFMAKFPKVSEYEARCSLGSFLFKGDDVLKKIEVLSGGERVRLQLCKILYTKPNVLILDEPTNHLDIVGREYLESILREYQGTVLFVSHDRYFISKVATSLLVLTKDDYSLFKGNYKEYLERIKGQNIDNNTSKNIDDNSKNKSDVLDEPKKKVNTYNLGKEINKLEREIKKLEEKIKSLEESLYLEEVYSDYDKLNQVNNEIKEDKERLEELNTKWLELMETSERQ